MNSYTAGEGYQSCHETKERNSWYSGAHSRLFFTQSWPNGHILGGNLVCGGWLLRSHYHGQGLWRPKVSFKSNFAFVGNTIVALRQIRSLAKWPVPVRQYRCRWSPQQVQGGPYYCWPEGLRVRAEKLTNLSYFFHELKPSFVQLPGESGVWGVFEIAGLDYGWGRVGKQPFQKKMCREVVERNN